MPEGIRIRHSRSCRSREGARCSCKPTYEAFVYSSRDHKKIRRSFPTQAAARQWRADAQRQVHRGAMRAPTNTTVREAAETWLEGARQGTIRNRSGDRYKPSAIRGYEQALRLRVLRDLGALKLSELARTDVQDLVDRLLAQGAGASTIRNTLLPLRAIYRRAVGRGEVMVNPTQGIELPAVRGRRERIASPKEASQLLSALPDSERPIWAIAFYAGLRLGELRALEWGDVDLTKGRVRVERAWDPRAGVIEPKSRAGKRQVPIIGLLRAELVQYRLRQGGQGLVFPSASGAPFNPSTTNSRARRAWESAGLKPLTLHDARHTFASLMIAAAVNLKALSAFMGHSSITVTMDRYGHLLPGSQEEAAELMDAYLERMSAPAR